MPKIWSPSGVMVTALMKNKTLGRQLFLFFLAFSLFLLGLLWVFQTVLLNDSYRIIREKEVDQAIKVVGKHINSSDLNQVLEDLNQRKNIRVRVGEDFQLPKILDDLFDLDLFPHTLSKTHSYSLKDGSRVSLTFYALLSPTDPLISTLRFQLVLISFLMLFLSILAALYLSKRIARPIVEVNDQAKLLALGHYQADFKAQGYVEIDELSQTLNQAARELSKVEDQRRDLLANVSHDLRTPLALIYSQAEIMEDFPEERKTDRIHTILEETKRLSLLVNALIDEAQLDRGQISLDIKTFSLTRTLKETIHRVNTMVKDQGYLITFSWDEDCSLQGDQEKITQAFYNLLSNALAYSEPGQPIEVSQEKKKNTVVITVTDHGQGIREEDLPHIWTRYYRGERDKPIPGTGLGLSIVKEIVALHGGRVDVQSSYQKGSSFFIELPLKS